MTSRSTGESAERSAEQYLKRHGFRTKFRNYTTRMGEIDLIMSKGALTLFVEVRLRRHSAFGTGADSVTVAKQKRIIRTAEHYLQKFPPDADESFRFDVVSISADGSIDWIPEAFYLN